MSILLDDGQLAIAIESRRIVDAKANPQRALELLESKDAFDQSYWDMCKEQGWTAVALPEADGGLGLSLVELGSIATAIGSAGAGAPFLTSSFGALFAIATYGDAAQKSAWVEKLASGETIGAIAFAEGQSPIPSTPTVQFSDGKLTGNKLAVSGGSKADVAIVLASESGLPVLVVADLSGTTRRVLDTFDNSRCTADLTFNGCAASKLSGDDALAAALTILSQQSVVTAHEQTGGAEAMMIRARDYAITRRAFGQLIGGFQSVKHRIAEMYGHVELARAAAVHAASRAGEADFIKAAAAARLLATDAYDICSRDCVQVHGGIGVTWESGIHLHLRRTRTLAIEQGNMLFWEDVLVNQLTGEAA